MRTRLIAPIERTAETGRVGRVACPVVPIAGKQATGVEVHLQGSVASELGEHIVQSAGVPRRFVLVKDKAKG